MNLEDLLLVAILEFHPTHGPILLESFSLSDLQAAYMHFGDLSTMNSQIEKSCYLREKLNATKQGKENTQSTNESEPRWVHYFPFYGIPDGAHRYSTLLNYFHLDLTKDPQLSGTVIYGLSCCVQNRTNDKGKRNGYMHSVVLLSQNPKPLRDFVSREKFRRESILFFDQFIIKEKDASEVNKILKTFLNGILTWGASMAPAIVIVPGRSQRYSQEKMTFSPLYQLWQKWDSRLLILWKLILTDTINIILYSEKSEKIFLFLDCLYFSTQKDQLKNLLDQRYLQPYLPLNELDEVLGNLKKGSIKGLLIGTTNKLMTNLDVFKDTTNGTTTVLVDLDTCQLHGCPLKLTKADIDFMNALRQSINYLITRKKDTRRDGLSIGARYSPINYSATNDQIMMVDFQSLTDILSEQLWRYYERFLLTIKYYYYFQHHQHYIRVKNKEKEKVQEFSSYLKDFDADWFKFEWAFSSRFESDILNCDKMQPCEQIHHSDTSEQIPVDHSVPNSPLNLELQLREAIDSHLPKTNASNMTRWLFGDPPFHPGRFPL